MYHSFVTAISQRREERRVMKKTILLADDEKRMRILLSDLLQHEGFLVTEAEDGDKALDLFRESKDISMALLDVMMPKVDGWQVCREIKNNSDIPVIILTAKNTEGDELHSFSSGADEYIKKPFSLPVLAARVKALMKRTYGDTETPCVLGNISIFENRRTITVNSRDIELNRREFDLLLCFAKNEKITMTREDLLNRVWGYDYNGTDRTVDTHINRLRDKLGNEGRYITTVRGKGYRFEVKR